MEVLSRRNLLALPFSTAATVAVMEVLEIPFKKSIDNNGFPYKQSWLTHTTTILGRQKWHYQLESKAHSLIVNGAFFDQYILDGQLLQIWLRLMAKNNIFFSSAMGEPQQPLPKAAFMTTLQPTDITNLSLSWMDGRIVELHVNEQNALDKTKLHPLHSWLK